MKCAFDDRLARTVLVMFAAIDTGCAAVANPRQTAITRLAAGGAVSCQPALPHFCANIHVACSGPSTIRTFPFALRARADQGSIESSSDTAGIGEIYTNGRVAWDSELSYVILRPHQGNGYIKLLADGTFSFRLYLQNASAVMTYGRCF